MDWRASGLASLAPPPESYLERQLSRFARLSAHNRRATCRWSTG